MSPRLRADDPHSAGAKRRCEQILDSAILSSEAQTGLHVMIHVKLEEFEEHVLT